MSGWLTFGGAGTRPGSTAAQVGPFRESWFTPLPGTVTTQPIVVRNVPGNGDTTVYVGTASGFVYALAANGYVRWRADLGRFFHPTCDQIPDGWGVTGTPVADAATRTLYVADAFGRLHALDLATGDERAGWPVVIYSDYRRELVWGALLLTGGSVYVPTGAYCDLPMEGRLIRVALQTRKVSSWTAVPASLGGGGGIWGWGGAARSARGDSIFVVTGNALEGGDNTGPAFSEEAGYGEHLVELSPDLRVRSASAPGLKGFADLDFVGSPVVVGAGACGELVAAQAKNGMLFGWRTAAIGSGPAWRLALQKTDAGAPLLTQPTWSARHRSFYVVTASKLVRVALGDDCRPRIVWQTPLGDSTLYPSPTVAGNTVWVGLPVKELSGVAEALLGIDATTGRVRVRRTIAGVSFAPPTILDGRLFVATMHGLSSRRFPVAHGRRATVLTEYTSRLDGLHVWQSREDGVYATDDGGRRWRRIYPVQAARVVRLSAREGVTAVGSPAPACGCATRRLVTRDGGRTWRVAPGIGESFQGRGSALYWWRGGRLFRADSSLRSSTRVAAVDGTIVAAANVPGGVAALVDRPGRGPQVITARGGDARIATLPPGDAGAVARSITAAGSTLVVRGVGYPTPAGRDRNVEWRSRDGAETWNFVG